MSVYGTCYGCGVPVPDEPGNAYCAVCIERQRREALAELEAFDAFHRWADRVGRKVT